MPLGKGNSGKKRKESAGEWKPIFLRALATYPVVGEACKAAGIARKTAYQWRKEDEAFRLAWEDAWQDGADALELVLIKRGIAKDNVALFFILKGIRPEVYRERHELAGPGGGPIPVQHDLSRLNQEELMALRGMLLKVETAPLTGGEAARRN